MANVYWALTVCQAPDQRLKLHDLISSSTLQGRGHSCSSFPGKKLRLREIKRKKILYPRPQLLSEGRGIQTMPLKFQSLDFPYKIILQSLGNSKKHKGKNKISLSPDINVNISARSLLFLYICEWAYTSFKQNWKHVDYEVFYSNFSPKVYHEHFPTS